VNEFSAKRNFVERIKSRVPLPSPEILAEEIAAGKRDSLAKAFTLLESQLHADQFYMSKVLQLLPNENATSIRIGITGVPGVGKSTFIEAFSKLILYKTEFRIAVLSVDPSSPITGGSILGDKTRMEELSLSDRAFIRPSPSGTYLGGVTRATANSIQLCEAAGFDLIFIETVGVGQSEVDVHGMTDFFLLLMLAGAGDQLQGIKRGIMELTDALIITKADGENTSKAGHAKIEYQSALHLFPNREDNWVPEVFTVSALELNGLDEVWQCVEKFNRHQTTNGSKEHKRKNQRLQLFLKQIEGGVLKLFMENSEVKNKFENLKLEIEHGNISPMEGSVKFIEELKSRLKDE
jgi:LAO/AO transport system kinase